MSLPDKSGQALIDEMLSIVTNCPIIILTGLSDIELSTHFISQGISDYLVKDDLHAVALYKSILYAIERRNNFIELRESEKRFSDLFYLSQQPNWIYDTETYNFLQVNKAALELFGYTQEELLSKNVFSIILQEDRETTKELIDGVNENKATLNQIKAKFVKKDGQIIESEIYSAPIVLSNKTYRSVIAIDITEKQLNEQKIMMAIIKTQEAERYEIGGELHDNVGQILASSLINLGMLKKHIKEDGTHWFDECKQNLNDSIKEIRNLSHRIAPKFFDDTTLEEAIRKLFHSFNVTNKYTLQLYFDQQVKQRVLDLELQLNVYRILQEQLKNIWKYADATVIELDVYIAKGRLGMRVSDNGVGFDPTNVTSGIGFANMKRRTELFNGKFEIVSSPSKGCSIFIDIPLEEGDN